MEDRRRSLENKKDALDRLLKSGRVPDSIYTSLDKELSDSLWIVDEIIRKVKEDIQNRILRLEEQASLLERVLSDLEVARRLNLVKEESYSKNLDSLLAGLNSTREEIKRLSGGAAKVTHENFEDLKPPIRLEKRRRKRVKKKVFIEEKSDDEYSLELEPGLTCKNPWNKNCKNRNIELFIYYRDEFIPICSNCWRELAEKDLNW